MEEASGERMGLGFVVLSRPWVFVRPDSTGDRQINFERMRLIGPRNGPGGQLVTRHRPTTGPWARARGCAITGCGLNCFLGHFLHKHCKGKMIFFSDFSLSE
jgi:hypothetical protein